MSGTADLPLTAAGQAAVDRHSEALAAYDEQPAQWRSAYPAMVSAIIEAYVRRAVTGIGPAPGIPGAGALLHRHG